MFTYENLANNISTIVQINIYQRASTYISTHTYIYIICMYIYIYHLSIHIPPPLSFSPMTWTLPAFGLRCPNVRAGRAEASFLMCSSCGARSCRIHIMYNIYIITSNSNMTNMICIFIYVLL
jgi:hypothetical protein